MSTNESRPHTVDYRFKILYALGMVLIVSGHCQGGGTDFLMSEWFPPYSFHVGLFVFVSGYFYKIGAETKLRQYILKKAKNLLIPLYLWNLFYAGFVFLLSFQGFTIGTPITPGALLWEPLTYGHQFMYNLGSWFVFPLFLVQCCSAFLRKLIRKMGLQINEWLFFLLGFSLGLAGIQLAAMGYHTGVWLTVARMAYFMPFYCLGMLYRTKLKKYDTLGNWLYFAMVFAVNIVIVRRYGYVPSYTPAWCHDFTEGPLMPFIVGFLGIAFWLRVARILEPAIGRSRSINLIADNTYTIMVNHYMGFMVLKTGFAVFAKYTPWFQDFDFYLYKTDWDYFYIYMDLWQMTAFYLLAGLLIPILMQKVVDHLKKDLQGNRSRTR